MSLVFKRHFQNETSLGRSNDGSSVLFIFKIGKLTSYSAVHSHSTHSSRSNNLKQIKGQLDAQTCIYLENAEQLFYSSSFTHSAKLHLWAQPWARACTHPHQGVAHTRAHAHGKEGRDETWLIPCSSLPTYSQGKPSKRLCASLRPRQAWLSQAGAGLSCLSQADYKRGTNSDQHSCASAVAPPPFL